MKIILDRTKCTGLGICESLAPDKFEIDDDGNLMLLSDTVTDDERDDVEAAIAGCPTEALRLVTDDDGR
ncbi:MULTISPECIES: ferredoxin [Rhodococcus]|uniref:ferredoxin n=1 Tax=Rhodococcus TaxID=1827 RepID=UPI00071E38E4|nr:MULTISPECIES: ferredoxin [Rhodococcus]ANQ75651.1 ferredoxin [Rhodococcus sp. 008]KSU70638.1 ferredoxin [Rhodococcus qingshengii]SCC64330.1 ferredoxin [Rhodococcus qingshengii]